MAKFSDACFNETINPINVIKDSDDGEIIKDGEKNTQDEYYAEPCPPLRTMFGHAPIREVMYVENTDEIYLIPKLDHYRKPVDVMQSRYLK